MPHISKDNRVMGSKTWSGQKAKLTDGKTKELKNS